MCHEIRHVQFIYTCDAPAGARKHSVKTRHVSLDLSYTFHIRSIHTCAMKYVVCSSYTRVTHLPAPENLASRRAMAFWALCMSTTSKSGRGRALMLRSCASAFIPLNPSRSGCTYIYVCTYIYIYTYCTYTYIYICVYIHNTYAYICTDIYRYMHV